MDADLDKARDFAADLLLRGMPAGLHYHDIRHTRDVVQASAELAQSEGVSDGEYRVLLTAGWFHDLGYSETRDGHEAVSARLAGEVLPGFGYGPRDVARICTLILATRMPHAPRDLGSMILVDADLDTLGRSDFPEWSDRLRRELAAQGQHYSLRDWHLRQHEFLSRHRYFTAAQRTRRNKGLAQNRQDLAGLLSGPV
jgi:uncharacterized protein